MFFHSNSLLIESSYQQERQIERLREREREKEKSGFRDNKVNNESLSNYQNKLDQW